MSIRPTIILAMTGASGIQYGLRLLECLLEADIRVHLLFSHPAQVVLNMETDWHLPGRPAAMERVLCERFEVDSKMLRVFGEQEWTAPFASGSSRCAGMVICPCTAGTLSAVATGASRSLIERAADVMLKERRKLILVLRETPLSEVHLENMLRVTRMGAVMMPASPGFYNRPKNVADLIDFMVARILDHLDVDHDLLPRWGDNSIQD